jgi:hypothetical protein
MERCMEYERGSQYARWLRVPKEGCNPVVKKRFRKKPMFKKIGDRIVGTV